MDASNNYKSYPIPNRRHVEATSSPTSPAQIGSVPGGFEPDPFAEIEMTQTAPAAPAYPIPPLQSAATPADDKRTLFYAMRQIAREDVSYQMNHAKLFYRQAVFMADFEDDYEDFEPFSSYYPFYQQMTYEQLRTYFTWRTQVRKGNIRNTSLSYAFLYIYELLNQIGVYSPEEGLERLVSFWHVFRAFDTALDRYVLQWLKDYHVYYPLERPFGKFAAANQLTSSYPAIFGYCSGEEDSFDLFTGISKYNIKKSVFYSEQTRSLMKGCFYYMLERFRERFCGRKRGFEDLVFYPSSKESVWTPFSRSLFYPVHSQPDRQVVLSEREFYCCRNGRWTYQTAILSDPGRELIGYIMKEMEASLRKLVKFKHKISADPKRCDSKIRSKLEKMGIVFPAFIQECAAGYYALSTRKIISVDVGNLDRIRRDALQIQEKLIVTEDEPEVIPPLPSEPAEPVQPVKTADPWLEWKASLSAPELEAVRLVLCGQSIQKLADENRIMLEVLADGINQKAMDFLGDTLLEVDGNVVLYEDYRDKLVEILDGKQ